MKDYQVMPTLSDEDFQALKSDIAAHGILVPLEFDDEGNILDGYHRKKAWDELKSEGINPLSKKQTAWFTSLFCGRYLDPPFK